MTETIQITKNENKGVCLPTEGYVEISGHDCSGIVKSFRNFLHTIDVDCGGIVRIHRLKSTNQAFLMETSDNRYLLASNPS